MKTFQQHLNLTCCKCGAGIGFAITTTGTCQNYGCVTYTCDKCNTSQSHNFYGVAKDSSLRIEEDDTPSIEKL